MMENDGGRSEKEALLKDASKESLCSFRPVAILVSLCVSFLLEYGTVSLLNPFLPIEVREATCDKIIVLISIAATARVIWLYACIRYCRPWGWCLSVSLAIFVCWLKFPVCMETASFSAGWIVWNTVNSL